MLIVEDDVDVAEVLSAILSERGFECRVVNSANDAGPILKRGGVDLLVTDIVLPGGTSGVALATLARRLGVPVVLVTGSHDAMRSCEAEGLSYIAKPIRAKELVRRVEAALAYGAVRAAA
jgi:DNA-binding response OmpR family regulator